MSTRAFLPGQLRLILAITLVHAIAWFAYYSQIPAGKIPTDDARVTLDAALSLAHGTASQANGYSLYTYCLSVLARIFDHADSLINAARGLNTLALILTTGFCASAAGHFWRRNRAVWCTGLLLGLNPVLVFWAGEVSAALPAAACVSIALWRALRWLRHPRLRDSLWVGGFLALGAAFETALLPIALAWPTLAYFFSRQERPAHFLSALVLPAALYALIALTSLNLQSPVQWNLNEIGLRLYDAFGNREQYDDKSYGLYRQLHLILFINPIHWGALFLLTCAGFYVRLKDGHRGHSVLMAILLLALFALSYALQESGSQARSSIIPLLSIFAAGVTLLPKIWSHKRKIQIGTVTVGLFTYACYLGAGTNITWERDYIYLAQANIALGNNDRASTWADKALELNPNSHGMQEVMILALFNDWATGNTPRSLPIESTREYLEATRQIVNTPTTYAIQGIYHYKLRETQAATAIWNSEAGDSALSLLCRYWTGEITELSTEQIAAYEDSPYHELLQEAQKINRSALEYNMTEKLLDNMLAFAY